MNAQSGNPPQITPVPEHPVYGRTPIGRDGFVLENQLMQVLNHWHEKAIRLGGEMLNAETVERPIDTNEEYDVLYEAKWDIYNAALQAKVHRASDVAFLLQIVSRQVADCGDIECALNAAQFAAITGKLVEVTQPLRSKKPFRQLARGRKLTRSGLLNRYQAFLIKELETLSWFMYGSRDYAKGFSIEDDAVNARCRGQNGKGHRYPFFDEHKLPSRARSVLKSLKIDSENISDRPLLPKSKRMSYDNKAGGVASVA